MEPAASVLTVAEAKSFLHVSYRSAEHLAKRMSEFTQSVDANNGDEPWLEALADECRRTVASLDEQLQRWGAFSRRADDSLIRLKTVATQAALDELAGRGGSTEGTAPFAHPELQKFKQEKTAKIIGKYGGVPALGPAMVLPAAPRQALRASGAPAAREIFCANAEARDAPGLAAVMQFQDNSSTKMAAGSSSDGSSAWQQELRSRQGGLAGFAAPLAAEGASNSGAAASGQALPLLAELSSALGRRQAAISSAEAAQAAAAEQAAQEARRAAPVAGADADAELTALLHHRRAAMAAGSSSGGPSQAADTFAGQAASDGGASNGGGMPLEHTAAELSARLAARRHAAPDPSSAGSSGGGAAGRGSAGGAAAAVTSLSEELAEKLRRRQAANGEM